MNDLVHGTGTQILSADSHLEAFARLRDELEKFDSVVFIGPGPSASWTLPPEYDTQAMRALRSVWVTRAVHMRLDSVWNTLERAPGDPWHPW